MPSNTPLTVSRFPSRKHDGVRLNSWGNESARIKQLVLEQLGTRSSSWSLGEFGALAEFHHVGKSLLVAQSLVSLLGNLRVESRQFQIIGYESISGHRDRWMHGLALCLRCSDAAMSRRTGITLLGPDKAAVGHVDPGSLLIDLGLGLRTVDFCVRTADRALIRILRANAGLDFMRQPGLYASVRDASPARVLISQAGRIEVTQRIPRAGERSPRGPHTHFPPGWKPRTRVHSANFAIPAGLVPCMNIYPAHPMYNAHGEAQTYASELHSRFQELMRVHGDRQFVRAKDRAFAAIESNVPPQVFGVGLARHERLATRVLLRQLRAQGHEQKPVREWSAFFEPGVRGH
jgi:hypothetical protein